MNVTESPAELPAKFITEWLNWDCIQIIFEALPIADAFRFACSAKSLLTSIDWRSRINSASKFPIIAFIAIFNPTLNAIFTMRYKPDSKLHSSVDAVVPTRNKPGSKLHSSVDANINSQWIIHNISPFIIDEIIFAAISIKLPVIANHLFNAGSSKVCKKILKFGFRGGSITWHQKYKGFYFSDEKGRIFEHRGKITYKHVAKFANVKIIAAALVLITDRNERIKFRSCCSQYKK